jgi:DNA-binding GntR family transcriptional regulator
MVLSPALKTTRPHLSPLSRRSLAEDATARLRRAVVSGELPAGASLPEDGLATLLGVSRVPVREALIELEQEGLVEFDQRGRSRVRAFTEADFEAVFSMRCALEVMAARLVVQRMTDADVKDLEAMIREQEAAKDLTELSLLDVAFHDRIIQAARHRPLAACWKTIRSQIEVWLARAHRAQAKRRLSSIKLTVPGHRRLMVGLCSGSERKAEAAMRLEMATWREWLPA